MSKATNTNTDVTPIVVGTKDGNLLVRIPSGGDLDSAFFDFSDIHQFKNDEIKCVLRTEAFPVGSRPIAYSSRINILSESAITSYARALKRFASNLELDRSLMEAIELVKERISSADEADTLENIKPEQAQMLFDPFLVRGAPSVLFGKGGGAKTYLSIRLALSLSSGVPFMGFKPSETVKTLFVDYEDIAGTFAARTWQLLTAEPLLSKNNPEKNLVYFNARGVPLPDLKIQLKRAIVNHNIGFVVVDSAVSACGGEPEKAETVSRYFNTLASLGVASLTIAHETKSENHAYPFGSVFWYNFPRSIWNVRSMRDDDNDMQAGSNKIETGLFHRKANNGPIMPFIPLQVEFLNDDEGKLDRVSIMRGIDATWEDEKSVPARIRAALRAGDKTRNELGDEMSDIPSTTLEQSLRRLRKKGEIELRGTKGTPYFLAKIKQNTFIPTSVGENIPF